MNKDEKTTAQSEDRFINVSLKNYSKDTKLQIASFFDVMVKRE